MTTKKTKKQPKTGRPRTADGRFKPKPKGAHRAKNRKPRAKRNPVLGEVVFHATTARGGTVIKAYRDARGIYSWEEISGGRSTASGMADSAANLKRMLDNHFRAYREFDPKVFRVTKDAVGVAVTGPKAKRNPPGHAAYAAGRDGNWARSQVRAALENSYLTARKILPGKPTADGFVYKVVLEPRGRVVYYQVHNGLYGGIPAQTRLVSAADARRAAK